MYFYSKKLRPSTSAGHLPPCLSTLQVKRKVSSNLSYFRLVGYDRQSASQRCPS